MSPEQVRGGKLDFRSDIYALGCVVYEVFAGQAPFHGENPMDTVMKQLHDPLPVDTEAARRIPAPVIAVLQKAMAKDPGERYQRVSEVTEALRAVRQAEGLPEPATRPLAVTAGPVASGTPPPPPGSPETRTLHRAAPSAQVDHGRAPTTSRSSPHRLLGGAVAGLVVAAVAWLAATGRPRPGEPSPSAVPVVAAPAPSALPVASTLVSPPPDVPSPRDSPSPALPSPSLPPVPARRPPSPAALSPSVLTPPSPVTVATVPAAVETGTLRLRIVPDSEVVLDGASLGRLSARELTLEAGPHTLRVLHPDYEPLQRKVTVRPGAVTQLELDLAEKAIRRPR